MTRHTTITADEFFARSEKRKQQEVSNMAASKNKNTAPATAKAERPEGWEDETSTDAIGFLIVDEGDVFVGEYQEELLTRKGNPYFHVKLLAPARAVSDGAEVAGKVGDVVSVLQGAVRRKFRTLNRGDLVRVTWGPEKKLEGGRRMRTAKEILTKRKSPARAPAPLAAPAANLDADDDVNY